MKRKHLFIALIALGIIGTVIFFPVNINDQYTCLFHRLQDDSITLSEISLYAGEKNTHHSILGFYLQGYAYLWWASILILVLGIYLHRRKSSLLNY